MITQKEFDSIEAMNTLNVMSIMDLNNANKALLEVVKSSGTKRSDFNLISILQNNDKVCGDLLENAKNTIDILSKYK